MRGGEGQQPARNQLSQTLKLMRAEPVQVVKKLAFPRSDSVRSNVSAYPVLAGGSSKVVRLIREDNPQTTP